MFERLRIRIATRASVRAVIINYIGFLSNNTIESITTERIFRSQLNPYAKSGYSISSFLKSEDFSSKFKNQRFKRTLFKK